MGKRATLIFLFAGLSVALLWLVSGASKAASKITFIDSFNTAQEISAPGPSGSAADSLVDPDVLGGERDIQAKVTSGVSGESVDVSTDTAGNSIYSHSQGVTTQGWSQIVWDGPDHNPTSIDYTGLSNADLTNGSTNDVFIIGVARKDWPATVIITVYTDKTHWSEDSVYMPDILTSLRMFSFPFADFKKGSGASGPADFTHVGAVSLMVDGTDPVSRGLDMDIQFIQVAGYDYGDLPQSGTHYATKLNRDGPRHSPNGLILGSRIDVEPDGQPDAHAGRYSGGDDFHGGPDDEDGVTRPSNWTQGNGGGPIDVTVSGGNGCLNGWIDWANDGSMETAGDQVFTNVPVSSGVNHLSVNVPVDPANQTFFTLFRLSPQDSSGKCTTPVGLTGAIDGGEVESYEWGFGPTSVKLVSLVALPGPSSPLTFGLFALGLVALAAAGISWRKLRKD